MMKLKNLFNNRFLPIFLMLSLLVLGLTACGSDDDPTEINPSDTTAPTVVSITPESGSLRVATDVEVVVTFSEAMDTLITTAGVGFGAHDTDQAFWASTTELHFTPVGLPQGEQVTLSVTTAMKDLAGNALAEDFSIPVFIENEEFGVLTSNPQNGQSGISRDISPVISFTQAPNMASLAANIGVAQVLRGADLSYTMTALNDFDVQLDFTTELPPNVQIRLAVGTGAISMDGDSMPAMWEIYFSTGETGDTTAPMVRMVDPANSLPNVPLDQTVTVAFSEPMAPVGTVILSSGTAFNTRWAAPDTFKFGTFDIAQGAEITVTLDSSFTDLAGNALEEFSWSFTTASDVFSVLAVDPTDWATDISLDVMPVISFSQRVHIFSIASGIQVDQGGETMNTALYDLVQLSYNNVGISFHDPLEPNTIYDIYFLDSLTSYDGDPIDQHSASSFTTGTTGDTTGPVLVSVFPPNGATVSPNTQSIVFEFNEPIDPQSFEPTSFNTNFMFWIMDMEETNNNQTFTLYLSAPLPEGITMDMVLGDLVDVAGNAMATELEYGLTVAGTPDFFPVENEWSYYQYQAAGDMEVDLICQYEYLTHPHFVRNFWVSQPDKGEGPDSQWFYVEDPEFVRFEGYGPELDSPCEPPVRWMGLSETATAWHDTVHYFTDTGSGYFDGSLIGIEDLQYMGEGAPEGMYWGDCRHYQHSWYSDVEGGARLYYLWDLWYAPGVGIVREDIESFDSSGESQGVGRIHTIALDIGRNPVKADGNDSWWSSCSKMGMDENRTSDGISEFIFGPWR